MMVDVWEDNIQGGAHPIATNAARHHIECSHRVTVHPRLLSYQDNGLQGKMTSFLIADMFARKVHSVIVKVVTC